MASQASPASPVAHAWPWRAGVLFLILAITVWRLLYLARYCPLDLAPDEAHYWDWSRHLDWSYYSKGPLVAYLIHVSCALFGDWSQQLMASEMLAVRIPAVLCGSLLLVALYVLTVQVYHSERRAAAVVALALTLPPLAAGSSLMTIDAPYTCCWAWTLVFGLHAVRTNAWWAWMMTGLVAGVGILAKYTMVLWLPSLGLFLLTSRSHRHLLLRPGVWLTATVAAACCLPILVWNIQNGWVSLKHVERLSRVQSAGIRWGGPSAYVGVQFALLLGFWFLAWVAAMWKHRPWKEANADLRYLWWLSAPTFLLFLAFSLKTGGGEANWPVTAYISGLVLATGWLAEQLHSSVAWYRRSVAALAAMTCVAGILLIVVMHRSNILHPWLARVAGPATREEPMPVRKYDPTCRLRGWRTLAVAVDKLRRRLEAAGSDPVLAAVSWSLPGELGFYCEGHPTVYSVGPPLGDRRSQYDLWRPNPVQDPESFRGRTFIVVSYGDIGLQHAFERVERIRVVTHHEGGNLLAVWAITVGHGFRGFPVTPDAPRIHY